MSDTFIKKLTLIIFYLSIIFLTLLILGMIYNLTTREKQIEQIKNIAQKQSIKKKKSLIVFDSPTTGYTDLNEKFDGNVLEILSNLTDNCCIILMMNVFEYIDSKSIPKIIKDMSRVSGGDFFILCIDNKSPRTFYDYKIKNLMKKSSYMSDDKIEWDKPNNLQAKISNIYYWIFKILPYSFFVK